MKENPTTNNEIKPFSRWMASVLAIALLALLAGGTWLYNSQKQTLRQEAVEDLTVIAQFKADQIAAWRAERQSDAAVLIEGSPFFVRALARFLADPRDEDVHWILIRFQSLVTYYHYNDVLLVDPEGRVRLSLTGDSQLHSEYNAAMSAAVLERRPVLTELHVGEQKPAPHISVVMPFFKDDGRSTLPLGAVILVSDATRFLYPLIQSWPTPSRTAETVAVRRDGEDVLFLNDLRHQPDTALKLRIPLTQADVPAVMAAQGRKGMVEGKDYRGVDVVSVIQPIPDSPWFMVAKVDAAEVFGAWRFRALLILGLLAALAAGLGAVALIVWQRNQKAHYLDLYLAETRLRANVERHSITLKAVGDAVIATDARGRVELLNPVAEALTGWTEAEAFGRDLEAVFQIINEETGQKVENPVTKVLRKGTVIGLANHTLLIAKNGSRLPIADSGAPVHDAHGKIIGVVLVFRDQTEERRTERLNRARLALLEYAPSHTLEALLTKTLDEIGALLDSPIGFFHFVGSDQKTLSLQHWSTRTLQEFCRAEDRDRHYRIDQAGVWVDCVRAKKPVVHNDYASLPHKKGMPEGHPEVIRELVVPVKREDKIVAILGVGNKPADYTDKDLETAAYLADVIWNLVEQKRAEAELHRIEWLLAPKPSANAEPYMPPYGDLTTLNAGGLIYTSVGEHMLADIVSDYLDLLETSAAVYEKNGDYALGIFSSGWCRFMDAASRRLCGSTDNQAALSGGKWLCHESCWTANSKVAIDNGQPVDIACEGGIRMYGVPIFAGGNVVGAINFGYGSPPQDPVSLKKLAARYGVNEEDLRRHAETYETRPPFIIETAKKRLAASARLIGEIIERKQAENERERLQEQLVQAQKMEAVGRLAGGVAHDFNNMLGIITGYAELALDRVKSDDPLHADLQEIHSAAKRSADLTRQLLAFARRQTIAPKTLDLNDTMEGMLKMLRRLIGEDIDLSWQPGPKLWPVHMDPAQLDQVLANLCINSRDAISGVGKITIETENVAFDAAYCEDHSGFIAGEYVLLAVSDDGGGMEKETLDKLFEPFFTTKGVGKGTGLGLATVYGIVKQNSGFINVYSEPDKGSTFKIYLPRRSEGAVEIREAGGMQAPAGQGETVLIVEDEASILKLGKKILEGLSYNVLTAGTPAEALSLAQQHGGRIDLLITDVVMPEMNGRDLAERLKGHYPDLKVLFMSGYTANVIAHHGVLDEGVDFIPKPFSRQEMAAKVRQALDI